MGKNRHTLLGCTVAAGLTLGGATTGTVSAHSSTALAPQALAYVSNGQVQVFEAGSLTSVGPGQSPVWSPNGAKLLYMRADFSLNTADLYLADTHGANSQRLLTGAYPYVVPSWSQDSKSVVYAAVKAGAKATGTTIPLEIRAIDTSTKKVRVLGTISTGGGCSTTGSALQIAASIAEGSYRGTPSTLILAQPKTLVVQTSCSGMGLSVQKIGGKATILKGWFGGVLSPDGNTVAAVVDTLGPIQTSQIGLISVSTLKTRLLPFVSGVSMLTWLANSSGVLGVVEPTTSATGSAKVVSISVDGKTITPLGSVAGSGAYRPSVDRTGGSIAMAVVANAPLKVAAVPMTTISLLSTASSAPARPFFIGSEPMWRP